MDYHRDRFQDYSLLIRDEKGKLQALLPANRHDNTVSSHGGLTYGGFIINSSMKAANLLEIFDNTLTYLRQNEFVNFIYKTVPYIYHQVPAEEDRYALFLCNATMVRRGLLTVVSKDYTVPFQERRWRGVQKALKNNLEVRCTNDFETFWEILTTNLKLTYNTSPVHSLKEICLLHSRFPNNIKLYGCYQDNTMVSGVVIYESSKVAHVQYIAASPKGKELSSLDLVFHELLNSVYKSKPFFDFGTSDEKNGYYLNRGLLEHKEGFGARMMVHDHYQIYLHSWRPGQIIRAMEER
jgi:hypothetical protein